MKKIVIGLTALLISGIVFAAPEITAKKANEKVAQATAKKPEVTVDDDAPVWPGARLVAGDPKKDEFFILDAKSDPSKDNDLYYSTHEAEAEQIAQNEKEVAAVGTALKAIPKTVEVEKTAKKFAKKSDTAIKPDAEVKKVPTMTENDSEEELKELEAPKLKLSKNKPSKIKILKAVASQQAVGHKLFALKTSKSFHPQMKNSQQLAKHQSKVDLIKVIKLDFSHKPSHKVAAKKVVTKIKVATATPAHSKVDLIKVIKLDFSHKPYHRVADKRVLTKIKVAASKQSHTKTRV